MLSKLQPQSASSGAADYSQQGDADTATLHETTERLQGQHLSGLADGAVGAAFMTPAGASWPAGRSPAIGVRLPLKLSGRVMHI